MFRQGAKPHSQVPNVRNDQWKPQGSDRQSSSFRSPTFEYWCAASEKTGVGNRDWSAHLYLLERWNLSTGGKDVFDTLPSITIAVLIQVVPEDSVTVAKS